MRFIVEGRAPEVGDVMDLRKYLQEVGINSPVPVEKPPESRADREAREMRERNDETERRLREKRKKEKEEDEASNFGVEWSQHGYGKLKSEDAFEVAWDALLKGKFHGYTQSTISTRPYRQAANKAWAQSRKVKRGRTRKRYARNKSRGTVRPAMRRQLGAGGSRFSTKR